MKVSWLHVSDFHIKAGDPYDRDVVLRALIASVRDFRQRGRAPDLIFATGDIAHSGKAAEYDLATSFFDDLLAAAGLKRRDLFVIPGNHDVNRDLGVGLARTLDSRELADVYFGPAVPKVHLTQKQGAFLEWHNRYFQGIRGFPQDSTCGPIEAVEIRGTRIGILPLNSALFCQDDHDHAKLWIGRRCLDAGIAKLRELDVQLKVGLVHHPLDWLNDFERSNIKATLQANLDVLLRGHLHETDVEEIGDLLHIAAGASYQTRKWPNRALYVTVEDEHLTVFPVRYEDHPQEIWTIDPSLFPREPGYQKRFRIPRSISEAQPSASPSERPALPRFRSNVPSRRSLPFVGRDKLLEEIGARLTGSSKEAFLVLHGPPGVGKSEVAREFARRQLERYPGGIFFLDASPGGVAIDLARIGANILSLSFPPGLPLPDQAEQTLLSLGATPALLIYDAVRTMESIRPWLPPAGMPCHVLITTVSENWDPGWPCLAVEPLSDAVSLDLIEKLAGREVTARHGQALSRLAEGLPVQICSAAMTLAYEARRGRLDSVRLALTREARESFRLVYEHLDPPVRLLLHAAAFLNPQRIGREELYRHLAAASGWSDSEYERLLDACLDLHLLEGGPELRMHQLFARYLLSLPLSGEDAKRLAQIRLVQRDRAVELAKALSESPADSELASLLMMFPLHPDKWDEAQVAFTIEEGEALGGGLIEIGRFADARPWYERAVEAKQKGDAEGRIDRASLGSSLYELGYCLSSVGRFEEAQRWFERSVDAKSKGDAHGQIDFASVGSSLYQVGYCLSSVGRFEEARPWYERSVEAKQKGDIQGHVNNDSLGLSLHQVGYCLSETGRFDEAQAWYERSVEAKQKGDIHGRVDYKNLGISLYTVGYCLSATGRFDEAQPWYERSVEAEQKGDIHGRVDHDGLGASLHQVGFCLSQMGKFDEARPWYERAVEITQKGDIHGRFDHQKIGRSLHQVGYCLSETGRFDEARPWYEHAVEAKQKGDLYGRVDHENVGSSLHQVGYCLSETGRFDEARPWYEHAVEAKQKGDIHGRVDHQSLGASMYTVGYCLSAMGRFDEAQPWYERSVEAEQKGDIHGRIDHGSLGVSLHQVGFCLSQMGKFNEARPWYERAVEVTQKGDIHGRIDYEKIGRSLHQVGYCLSETGKFGEARPWYERAVEAKQKGDIHGRVDHDSLGLSLHQVGFCLSQTGKFDEARPWYERAVEVTQKGDIHGRVNHDRLGLSLHQVGYCLSETGKFGEARPWYERAVEAKQKGDIHGRVDHDSLGLSLHQVGYCLSETGKFDEARPWFERAVEGKRQGDIHGRVDHESLGRSLHRVGGSLASMERFEEALPWYKRALEAKRKGDIYGRVDADSLDLSLREGAECLRRMDRLEEAREWESSCAS
jgi:tetratricopeptide (TPR) repeat protein/UDP-2,3-diacylglucosamine pyrophosphatase LpxH